MITVEMLIADMSIVPATDSDAEAMGFAVDAANDIVTRWRPDIAPSDGPWAPRATKAALQEAARLYGRRGSVQGVAAYADVGVSTIARLDPDLRSLLELGEYQPSVVA